MNKMTLPRCLLLGLTLISIPFASAQNGLPVVQPNHLTLIREFVKVGHGAAHARNEAGWPAAFEKAKSPDYYVALTSVTGPTEAWFLIPSVSYADEAAGMKRDAKDPVLSAELDRLSLADSEFITGSTTIQLQARPDLSLGKFPTVAKIRFYEILIFSVRPGQQDKFEAVAKAYAGARKRVSPDASFRTYEVVAGMPGPTYFVLSSVEDYGDFDRTMAEDAKVYPALNAEEKAAFDKWGEAVSKAETERFRLDPGMSYVSREVRASDPDFWMAK